MAEAISDTDALAGLFTEACNGLVSFTVDDAGGVTITVGEAEFEYDGPAEAWAGYLTKPWVAHF